MSSWLWRVASLTVAPPTDDRLQLREGHQRPGAADVDLDVVEGRGDRGRGELVGDRPARRPAHVPEALLDRDLVDLDHRPVDVEVDRPPPVLPGLALRLDLLDGRHDPDVGVHAEARGAQPLQGGGLGRQVEPLGVADAVGPDRERPLRRGGGVELPEAAGGRVAGVGEGRQAGGGARLVELGEGPERQVDLPPHLDHRRRRLAVGRPQALGDGADRPQVGRHVLPHDAVAARRPLREAAVLVGQRDRQAVDLGLDDERHLAGAEPLLLHDGPRAPVPGRELLGAAGVGEAEHLAAVADLGEAPRRRRPHPLGRRVRGAQPGVGLLERLQLAHPVVVDRVVDRGLVEDVVGVVGLVDQLAELGGPGGGLAHGASPRQARTMSAGVSTIRSGPASSRAAREKKPQVTPIVTTPAARPDSMSKGESPT